MPEFDSASPRARRVLILLAHPSPDESEVNLPMIRASAKLEGVTVLDLYAEYPDFVIDVEREQARLREHDIIVFQFPLYCYSVPALLKEWQDLVLEYGFAYGSGGEALAGKIFFCAVSAGGLSSNYQSGLSDHFTLRALLQPLERMAMLCGMRYLPPFALFGARTAVDEGRVRRHVEDWVKLLGALQTRAMRTSAVKDLALLNEALTRDNKET